MYFYRAICHTGIVLKVRIWKENFQLLCIPILTAMVTHTASTTGNNDDNVIFGANKSEMERLDMQHKVILASKPDLIQAPIDFSKPGLKILDQATGSGKHIEMLITLTSFKIK